MAEGEHRPGDEVPSRPPRRLALGVLVRWETLLLVLLGGTIAYGAAVSPYFLQSSNLFYICLNVGEIAIMALPLTLIVVTGEIDLSVASILGLAGVLMAELFKHGWPIWPAMIMAVVLGAFLGAALGALLLNTINSALVVVKVSSFWSQALAGGLLVGAIAFDRLIAVRVAPALRTRRRARG